jgi:hypothetical protein
VNGFRRLWVVQIMAYSARSSSELAEAACLDALTRLERLGTAILRDQPVHVLTCSRELLVVRCMDAYKTPRALFDRLEDRYCLVVVTAKSRRVH